MYAGCHGLGHACHMTGHFKSRLSVSYRKGKGGFDPGTNGNWSKNSVGTVTRVIRIPRNGLTLVMLVVR